MPFRYSRLGSLDVVLVHIRQESSPSVLDRAMARQTRMISGLWANHSRPSITTRHISMSAGYRIGLISRLGIGFHKGLAVLD